MPALSCQDDRGCRVGVRADALGAAALGSLRELVALAPLRLVLASLRLLTSPPALALGLYLVLIILLVVLARKEGPLVLGLLLCTPVATPLIMSGIRSGRLALEVPGTLRTALVHAALRRRLCPACRYSLQGLDPDLDACVQCPECGAAWLTTRFEADGRLPEHVVVLGLNPDSSDLTR